MKKNTAGIMSILNSKIASYEYQDLEIIYFNYLEQSASDESLGSYSVEAKKILQEHPLLQRYLKIDKNKKCSLTKLSTLIKQLPDEYLFQAQYLQAYVKHYNLDFRKLNKKTIEFLREKLLEIAKGPSYGFAYQTLARLEKYEKNYLKAEAYLKLLPYSDSALEDLIALYCEKGNFGEAFSTLKMIVSTHKKRLCAHYFSSYKNWVLSYIDELEEKQMQLKKCEKKEALLSSSKLELLKYDKLALELKVLETQSMPGMLADTKEIPKVKSTRYYFDSYIKTLEIQKKEKQKKKIL